MLALLKWLVIRLAAVRWVLKAFGGLAFLLPVAFLLKVIGLPIVAVLSVLALPVFFMLFVFGLPIILVLLGGGLVMAVLFAVLTLGLIALKVFIFIVVPAWLVWKLVSWAFRFVRRGFGGGDGGGSGGATGGPATTPGAPPSATSGAGTPDVGPTPGESPA